ncbi:hypothetical protein ABZ383_30440 [Streptomyces sp. NPDC005900]|uniref:hypothetical protein n=1 Tax=Streptomyces sp. NPDC005900 TaxID=3154569 RepID=UPI0033E9EA52
MNTITARHGDEALRRSVAADIGPRQPGTVYRNVDGEFRVLDLILDRDQARRLLNRRSAQFALRVIDQQRDNAQPFVIGSVWTSSDQLVTVGGA